MAHEHLPPEVMYQIAEFFTPAQAMAPSLVNRYWNNIFADRTWSKCILSEHGRLPPVAGLHRNAKHVTELYYFGTQLPPEYLSAPFTRLTRLALHHCTDNTTKGGIARSVAQLVERNDSLQELVLDDPNLAGVHEIWQQISLKRPRLQRVAFDGLALTPAEFAVFWKSCCIGVQYLNLTAFKGLASVEEDGKTEKYDFWEGLEPLPEVQSVTLGQEATVPLLPLFPNLRKVNLHPSANGRSLAKLTELVRGGHLKQLDSLHLSPPYDVRGAHPKRLDNLHLSPPYDDHRAASLLEGMVHVKEFVVRSPQTLYRSSKALNRHFSTLQVVSFRMENGVPDGMFLTLLKSCPLLTHISGPPISAGEIIHDKAPWVCTKLQTFKLFVTVSDSCFSTESRAVFERLAGLEYLTELSIGSPSRWASVLVRGLDLTLASGLGQLSTLTRLTKLEFSQAKQNMSSADVAWMKTHWKRLESVLGICNSHGGFRQQPKLRGELK
ncbi:hypothetical protein BGZ52_006173 [Haplosporangium bisporale]|nr:hypothetical protein BGZ52_006173 [Haplosporangium bisporale]